MQISTEHGFAFLCVPKCASTSIESAIQNYCDISFSGRPELKHMNFREYEKYIEPYLRGIFPDMKVEVFCTIRDPAERLVSWYRYKSRAELIGNKERYAGHVSFEEFVDAAMSRKPPSYARFHSQSGFIRRRNGEIGAERMFPTNRMDLVSEYLRGKIGQEIEIPQKNISERSMDNIDLSTSMREKIKDFYSDEYEIYNSISA